ncbi:oxidoreductase [Rhizobium lusitanum]|uniref:NAD(P)-dependent dehydrogenase (Short-subunit alcohol dehydrogenase family) n=1 Tax=Rhizobium lusitanum TaxID=293958 RepID=A0A7X0IZX6_9HYPH|nr:oxidoreductase [Rhizobium lusitanum]MBB6488821.1 NAD(P)-dependent dehydrogenase (short-subunit alcohol dehydrogenase family) [Rhizobium lusitanum]
MNTWFITGVSSGFGRAIAQAALNAGDHVVGTLRSEKDRADFSAIAPGRCDGVLLDVADEAAIAPTIERVEREIGPIDVLVNNAGYGHEGIVEESTLEEMRRQFDVNLFGAVAVTKAVLPGMRIRRAGRIINITSMGGFITMPGLGFYHASKFALEGFTETLGKEVKDFGIHVTAVEPGSFRTNWGGSSMVRTSRSIADYDALMNPLRERRKAYDGRQIGDPAKLGAAVVTLAGSANPPAHLLLGSDALRLVEEKLALMQAEIAAWRHITLAMDFAE